MAKIAFKIDASLGHGSSSDWPVAVVEDNQNHGYLVDIREYIARFGNTDGWPGEFYVIEITGLPASLARRVMQPYLRPATVLDPEWNNDPIDRYVYLGPNRWQFGKQDRIPPNLRNQLNKDFFLQYDDSQQVRDQINAYMVDRVQDHGVAIGDFLLNETATRWDYPPIEG